MPRKFSELAHQNDLYDDEQLKRNELLYRGGREFQKNIEMFLSDDDLATESQEFHEERKKASYDPAFARAADHFVSILMSEQLQIVESTDTSTTGTPGRKLTKEEESVLKLFQKNCLKPTKTGKTLSLHDHVKEQLRKAITHGKTFSIVDYGSKTYDSLGEQLRAKALQPFIVETNDCELIDWEFAEDGSLLWARFMKDCVSRATPFSPDEHFYFFKEVHMADAPKEETEEEPSEEVQPEPEEKEQVAVWQFYKSRNYEKNIKADNDEMVPEFGMPIYTTFTEIPIPFLCVPEGLNFGDVIGPMCEELYRVDSLIAAAVARNVITVPYICAGDDIPPPAGPINTIQTKLNRLVNPALAERQEGWLKLGKDDTPGILETQGTAVEALQKHRDKLAERILSAVHQSAQNIAVKNEQQAASAASKQEDRKDEEIMLHEFRMACERYVQTILRLTMPDVQLNVKGFCTEADEDRVQLLAEIAAFDTIPVHPEVFDENFLHSKLTALLDHDLSEEDDDLLMDQIQKLLKKRASDQEDSRQAELTAQTGILPNGKPVPKAQPISQN